MSTAIIGVGNIGKAAATHPPRRPWSVSSRRLGSTRHKVGGIDQAIRIETFGDLHQFGGLNGRLVTAGEAQALLAGSAA